MSVNGQTVATYDDQDRLLTYGGNSYSYNANGELTGETLPTGTLRYAYNALGDLTDVTLGSKQIHYLYDGQNRLVGKEVNGKLTEGFLYDGQLEPVAKLDGSGNIVEQFVYGTRPNVPDYILTAGEVYRVIANQVGSPVLIVNASTGAIAEQISYDAWGNVTQDTNPGFQPFGFAGGLYDPDTGLVHFGARDYDPQTGRWISKDPILFAGGNTNLYSYVVDDPINGIDSAGLWTFQMGFSGSITFPGGYTLTGFVGFAIDGRGEIAPIYGGGGGLGIGTGASGGVFIGASNANSVCDLGGPFDNLSLGGGWGPDATGDAFYGRGTQGQSVLGGTLTLGAGLGATAFGGATYTNIGSVGRLW